MKRHELFLIVSKTISSSHRLPPRPTPAQRRPDHSTAPAQRYHGGGGVQRKAEPGRCQLNSAE